MAFRGTDFVALHEAAFGDGQDDTLPADSWLVNRLWGNTMFLAGEPRMMAWHPAIHLANQIDVGVAQGVKPYAAISSPIAIRRGWVWLNPGQTGIRLWSVHTILDNENEGAGAGESNDDRMTFGLVVAGMGELRQRFWDGGSNGATGGNTNDADQTRTASPDDEIQRQSLTLTFDHPYRGQGGWRMMTFFCVSAVLDNISSTGTARLSGGLQIVDGNGTTEFFDEATSGNPEAANAWETMCATWQGNSANDNIYMDPIAVDIDLSAAAATRAHMTERTPVAYDDETLLGNALTYYQPRTLAYEPIFDLESAGSEPKSAWKPNIPVGSAPTLTQCSAIAEIHRRRRLVLQGPRGMLDSTYSNFYDIGYRICWPFVLGDAAETVLTSESFYLTTANPTLHLVCQFICIEHNSTMNFPSELKGKGEGVETPGSAFWTLTTQVDRIDDVASGGATWTDDATSLVTLEEDVQLELHGAHFSNGGEQPPVARGIDFMGSSDTADDARHWLKEGSLFPDLGDTAYLQTYKATLDVASMSVGDEHRPLRFRIAAEFDDTKPNDFLNPQGPAKSQDQSERVRLVLTSFSLWENPDDAWESL